MPHHHTFALWTCYVLWSQKNSFGVGFYGAEGHWAMYFTHHSKPWLNPISNVFRLDRARACRSRYGHERNKAKIKWGLFQRTSVNDVEIKVYQYMIVCTFVYKADSRFAPSQWETSLQCSIISHWLGANLESALVQIEAYLPLPIKVNYDRRFHISGAPNACLSVPVVPPAEEQPRYGETQGVIPSAHHLEQISMMSRVCLGFPNNMQENSWRPQTQRRKLFVEDQQNLELAPHTTHCRST